MTREIIITPVLNGWIVKAGCQTVVFDSIDNLLTELRAYYKDPEGVEKEYVRRAKNSVQPPPGTPPAPPPPPDYNIAGREPAPAAPPTATRAIRQE